MGTWNTDYADTVHAEYVISASLDGVTGCHCRVSLASSDASGDIVETDAEAVLEAVLSALGTNPDFTVNATTRNYSTFQSYTP